MMRCRQVRKPDKGGEGRKGHPEMQTDNIKCAGRHTHGYTHGHTDTHSFLSWQTPLSVYTCETSMPFSSVEILYCCNGKLL